MRDHKTTLNTSQPQDTGGGTGGRLDHPLGQQPPGTRKVGTRSSGWSHNPITKAAPADSPTHDRDESTAQVSEYVETLQHHQGDGPRRSAGPTALFNDADDYHDTVRAMIETGTILDEGMVYFDARLSRQYPTVELRVADVCTYAQDGALVAILSRALVDTAARACAAGVPAAPVRTELIRLGMWRASRSGLDTGLIDPLTQRPVPAETVIETFLAHIQDSLVEAGDDTAARELVTGLLSRGNGARLQRADLDRTGKLPEVVALAAQRTHPG